MPHLVSISAVTLPTPPTPTIATAKVRIFCEMQNYMSWLITRQKCHQKLFSFTEIIFKKLEKFIIPHSRLQFPFVSVPSGGLKQKKKKVLKLTIF